MEQIVKEISKNEIKSDSIDEEELKKRQERIKRFGIVEPIKPFERNYDKSRLFHNHKKFRNNNHNPHGSESKEEFDLEKIKPIKPKEEFRLNINENSELNKKRLLLFGVNLMSTSDVEDYLGSKNFKIKKMFWLNDYTCVLEFDTEILALKAFEEFCDFEIQKELSDFENLNWKKSLPFVIDEEKVLELEMRVSEDLEKKSSREDSTFYKFYNQRRKNVDHRYSNNLRRRERSRNKEMR